ncbi:hypothetical protein [Qipengyuania sp. JC766]|uniref:hypothetical protein n=1 Tax=Qipengyuania sp. JC766 TaxID=3232139 RepID=UPI003457D4C3
MRKPAIASLVAALALSACAGSYTGPAEVTRFVAQNPVNAGNRTIATVVDRDGGDASFFASAYEDAVEAELSQLGYAVNPADRSGQTAEIRVQRFGIDSAGRRSPVNVGVGGSTGSYGSGLGLGIGFNLGGGERPREVTELSVRIRGVGNETLWEGRAELVTSDNADLAEPRANAQALAEALFRGFPGKNGETITVDVK